MGVVALALSTDGGLIVSGSGDRDLRVWNIETGECLKVLEGHTEAVRSVALSVDGRTIVSGGDDNTLRVWNLETSECLKVLNGQQSSVSTIVLSADGRYAVSTTVEGCLHIWDLKAGECLRVLDGSSCEIFRVGLALSADGKTIISPSKNDGTFSVWDLASGRSLASFFERGTLSTLVSHTGGKLITGLLTGRVQAFNIENLPQGPVLATAQRQVVGENFPVCLSSAPPPCCSQIFDVPATVTERILYWSAHPGEDGYTDPALLMPCPHCQTPLRMTPFFVSAWSR